MFSENSIFLELFYVIIIYRYGGWYIPTLCRLINKQLETQIIIIIITSTAARFDAVLQLIFLHLHLINVPLINICNHTVSATNKCEIDGWNKINDVPILLLRGTPNRQQHNTVLLEFVSGCLLLVSHARLLIAVYSL